MASLIAIPIFAGLLVLQTTLISSFPLLRGTADLLLVVVVAWALHKRVLTAWNWAMIAGLLVSIASALPVGVAFLGYGLAAALSLLLRRRVWQVPIIAMFAATVISTLVFHLVTLVALRVAGNPLEWDTAFNLITLPSVLLNLIYAIPAYALVTDLANWIYPEELEV